MFGNSVMLIISSPSGTGKSTLTRMLADKNKKFDISVSFTTRKKREGEIDGMHYHFVSEEEYKRVLDAGDFLEHAMVHGNCYGTSCPEVKKSCDGKRDVLFDIDWQGARQLREKIDKKQLVTIFLLPPSISELHERLKRRAKDDNETIERRMKGAIDEISHYDEYDYVIVNDDLQATFEKVYSIYLAAKERIVTIDNIPDIVNKLLTS